MPIYRKAWKAIEAWLQEEGWETNELVVDPPWTFIAIDGEASWPDKYQVFHGFAKCNLRDKFSEIEGIRIAAARAVRKMARYMASREDAAMWLESALATDQFTTCMIEGELCYHDYSEEGPHG